jgi:hypothetical protein
MHIKEELELKKKKDLNVSIPPKQYSQKESKNQGYLLGPSSCI